MQKLTIEKTIQRKLKLIQKTALKNGIDEVLIKKYNFILCIAEVKQTQPYSCISRKLLISAVFVLLTLLLAVAVDYLLSARCLLPINHLVWEATRPLADCGYCANVTKPIILKNVTRQSFRV